MRKVEDAYRIRTVVVHQALQPLRAILHRAHLGGPRESPPMRFEQRCLLKTRGITQARAVRELLRADLPPPIARDLPDGERLDFDPLTPHQMHKGSIPTQRLLRCSTRGL